MSADEQLQQDWECFGRPEGYEAASEQEVRDLADRRDCKRGEATQRKRLKRSRQQLERERLTEQQHDWANSNPPPRSRSQSVDSRSWDLNLRAAPMSPTPWSLVCP